MKKIKKLSYTFSLFLVFILLICVPKTTAKFVYENYGIAWDNHFTSFSQLKEIFYIKTASGENREQLWGGISSGDTTVGKIVQHGDYYSFGNTTGNSTKSIENVKKSYGKYFIENMKNIELNCVNQTNSRMVIIFKLYYYAPRYKDLSTHISFGVYNTILHKNVANDEILKGEFVVDQGHADYTTGQYTNIVELPTTRTSGDANGQFITTSSDGGDYYYPHYSLINPYEILYDSGVPIETGHYDRTVTALGDWVISNRINGPASHKYPATDKNSSSSSGETLSEADNLMSNVSLEDFILEPSESGSFNLSLYFGNISNFLSNPELSDSQGTTSCCFVTSLELIATPESDIIADIEANGGTAPDTA